MKLSPVFVGELPLEHFSSICDNVREKLLSSKKITDLTSISKHELAVILRSNMQPLFGDQNIYSKNKESTETFILHVATILTQKKQPHHGAA